MSNWSEEIEEICDKLRVNCVNLSEYHRKRYYHFKSYGKWFRLPLIILASVNSTASVGLQPVLDQTIISGITCLIGMIMGIIGSLELYLGKKSFIPEVNDTLFERPETFDNNELIISLSDLSSYISVVYVFVSFTATSTQSRINKLFDVVV